VFKILTIPFDPAKESFSEDLLNEFCINKLVKDRRIEFFRSGEKAYWSVFLEYDVVLEPTGEKEHQGLNDAERMLFDRLRQWRKERAEKEGVPVYIVATNSEVRQIVKSAPKTLEALKLIKGFGRKKVEKYGEDLTAMIRAFFAEK